MMKIWWATNVLWLIFFTGTSIVIGVRNVDGAGVAQTPELKMLAFIILGGFFSSLS